MEKAKDDCMVGEKHIRFHNNESIINARFLGGGIGCRKGCREEVHAHVHDRALKIRAS